MTMNLTPKEIETAPTDGRLVLLFTKRWRVGYWYRGSGGSGLAGASGWKSQGGTWIHPTHWVPIPNDPKPQIRD